MHLRALCKAQSNADTLINNVKQNVQLTNVNWGKEFLINFFHNVMQNVD